jgi:hypothetical protein
MGHCDGAAVTQWGQSDLASATNLTSRRYNLICRLTTYELGYALAVSHNGPERPHELLSKFFELSWTEA